VSLPRRKEAIVRFLGLASGQWPSAAAGCAHKENELNEERRPQAKYPVHRCTDALSGCCYIIVDTAILPSGWKSRPKTRTIWEQIYNEDNYAVSTPDPRDTDSFLSLTCSSTKHRRLRLYRVSCAHNPLLRVKEADNDTRAICKCSKKPQPRLRRPL
jgi:hypothetical protein